MGGVDGPASETDIRALLKRAREGSASKPLTAWKLLYDGLPAVHEAVRAGRVKPTVLDAFLNEMSDLSQKIPPGELGKQFAAQRQKALWAEKTFEEMQLKIAESRNESQPLRDALEAEKQARLNAQAAADKAHEELKALTQKLITTTGQAGEAQTDARELKESVKKAEAMAAKDRREAERSRTMLKAKEAEAAKLGSALDEERVRAAGAAEAQVRAQQELDSLRAKHDALVSSVARGDLLPKETVEKLVEEAHRQAQEDRPVEVEDASATLKARIQEANDHLREAQENERAMKDQVEILKKQLENQRPALEQYIAVCEALGLDPTKVGALQTKVLGLLARSISTREDERK